MDSQTCLHSRHPAQLDNSTHLESLTSMKFLRRPSKYHHYYNLSYLGTKQARKLSTNQTFISTIEWIQLKINSFSSNFNRIIMKNNHSLQLFLHISLINSCNNLLWKTLLTQSLFLAYKNILTAKNLFTPQILDENSINTSVVKAVPFQLLTSNPVSSISLKSMGKIYA